MDKRLGEGQLSLRDYVQILWARRWMIVLIVIVAVGGSVVYDELETPVYQATAQLQFTTQVSSSVLQANSSSASAPNVVDVPTDGHE